MIFPLTTSIEEVLPKLQQDIPIDTKDHAFFSEIIWKRKGRPLLVFDEDTETLRELDEPQFSDFLTAFNS